MWDSIKIRIDGTLIGCSAVIFFFRRYRRNDWGAHDCLLSLCLPRPSPAYQFLADGRAGQSQLVLVKHTMPMFPKRFDLGRSECYSFRMDCEALPLAQL